MSITGDEIRALCVEQDRLMAAAAEERRIYAHGRFRSGSPPERLADGADIIYRQHDNSAPAPAPQPEPAPSYEEASTAPNFFDDIERNEAFADCLGYVIAELRREWKRDIQRMERRIKRTIERSTKADEVVYHLPDWRRRD